MNNIQTLSRVDLLSRIVISAVFFISALTKALSFNDTVVAVIGYEIIGTSLATATAAGLIAGEFILAAWSISGWKKQLFHQVSIVVFTVFIMLIASAWARGLEINCGCFGSSEVPENPVLGYIKDIARDFAFIAISGAGLWSVTQTRRFDHEEVDSEIRVPDLQYQ